MSRAIHHHQAHHLPRRHPRYVRSTAPSSWVQQILPHDTADWIAAALLVFGVSLIGYAIIVETHHTNDNDMPAFTRPSTYD